MMSDTLKHDLSNQMGYSLKGLVYEKIFKISSATNKKFSKGELQNIVNRDCEDLPGLFNKLTNVFTIPIFLLC